MTLLQSDLTLGLSFAALSGVMNGTFTLPMRYLGKWEWENVWSVFIVVSCLAMPIVVAVTTISNLRQALSLAPAAAIAVALATGFAWGFGAIMFGQGVSALGISMGNTLVLAISASLGSLLPIVVIAPAELFRSQGKAIVLGTAISVGGIVLCGYAGLRRERSQRGHQKEVRGDMVGQARPFWLGLLLSIGAGLLSAVFNIGYSAAHGIIEAASKLGNSAFAGSNLIWLLMLSSGAVANLGFCGYLFRKNRSWPKFIQKGSAPLYGLAVLMGLLWGGSIFVYGSAAPNLGRLGPAIGWPLSLAVGLLTANLCGILAGEWKLSEAAERRWMAAGLLVLLVGIAALGWSSTLR
jgi:L-rhamnose-H+ transport protein